MQTLLFEMRPRDGHEEHYFAHVAALRPIVMEQQGILFIQRYKSLSRPDVILSHSLWRDEAAIARWRNNKDHQKSQTAGRHKHFKDYRIRISNALYCHTEHDANAYQGTNGAYEESNPVADRFITIIRSTGLPKIDCVETYQSVGETNSYLSVSEFSIQAAGYEHWLAAQENDDTISAIMACVSRDYGMNDRFEAPQSFNPVDY